MATPGRFNAAVATALRDARTARGVTIDDLVRTSGMVRATVLRYLNNQREIPISALYTLAGALGVEAHAMVAAAETACMVDAEDENRTPPPPIEVARRIRLLVTAQSRGRGSLDGYAEVSTALADRGVVMTRETWAGLLAGNETEAPSTVLQDLAEVLGVDPVYLRGSRADSRVDAIDAQLEFARAAHDAGIDAIAARAISDVSAQTLRAVTAELDAART
ncbi:helix-turn-helix transcriptional regulator [Plantibacter sp. VKM Ac-2876]|uniref:helix-turn-helix domain-containing protein n=1 Tax=Plantibacter sp. VKM Ac-2876 TaxID=2783826 RepID=UPI00188AEE7F|nr:helix-turn-helix transcriptional regulator [Plantibacter sp. VKM Ac-2876]MBF4563947.1 helix-turn-helix transcriptional regulator [Plantibacter sp. VKM Ac-2876]